MIDVCNYYEVAYVHRVVNLPAGRQVCAIITKFLIFMIKIRGGPASAGPLVIASGETATVSPFVGLDHSVDDLLALFARTKTILQMNPDRVAIGLGHTWLIVNVVLQKLGLNVQALKHILGLGYF